MPESHLLSFLDRFSPDCPWLGTRGPRHPVARNMQDEVLPRTWEDIPLRAKRILIMSYLFPPVGGIGVQRALSLARYLPQCGFDVHVLKATNSGGPVMDPELLRMVPH